LADIPACKLDELTNGGVRRVRIGRRPIALVRVADSVYALNDVCPHKGGHLSDGRVSVARQEIMCPWHRFRFRLADGASATNPELVVRTYPVRVVDGEVLVSLP
jgi:nitrite reductase (NADH) small subunit